MTDSLAIAELVIYTILVIPAVFTLIKHGSKGALGWGFLGVFFLLRITGSILVIANIKSANIVSSIGLSPLLLASSGISHEVRFYANTGLPKGIELAVGVQFHMLVMAGVALLAVGSSHEQSGDGTSKDKTFIKVGAALLLVAWLFVVLVSGWTLRAMNRKLSKNLEEPKKLIYGLLSALVFIGVRVIYSLVALTSTNPKLNPINGTLAIRVVLSFLMELIAVLILLGAGLATRNIRHQVSQPTKLDEPRQYANFEADTPLRSA